MTPVGSAATENTSQELKLLFASCHHVSLIPQLVSEEPRHATDVLLRSGVKERSKAGLSTAAGEMRGVS